MKRLLRWAAGLLLGLVLLLGGAGYAVFGGLASLPAEQALPGRGYILKDTYVAIGVLNVGDGKLLLVDAGLDPDGGPLFAALRAHGQRATDVIGILLTHGHPDHSAGAPLFGGAKIYAMAAEAPFLAGSEAYLGPLPHLFGPQFLGVPLSDPLSDGASFTVGSLPVEAFAVPGHTAGSAAYLIDGTLFLGDSASLTSDGTLIGAPWVFSDDQATNRRALAGLATRLAPRAATIHTLCTSHTGCIEGFEALAAYSDDG